MAGHAIREAQPLMLGLRVHSTCRWRELGIRESADGHAHDVGQAFVFPEHGRTAGWAELKAEPGATVALPPEGAMFALRGDDLVAWIERARAEQGAGAPLASRQWQDETMRGSPASRIRSWPQAQAASRSMDTVMQPDLGVPASDARTALPRVCLRHQAAEHRQSLNSSGSS